MTKESEQEPEVLLPQSSEALDQFVASITEEYGLPSGDETSDSIATMIMHLPATRAWAPRSYFGNGVRKQIANLHAYNKLVELKHKRDAAQAEKEKQPAPKLEVVDGQSIQEQAVPGSLQSLESSP